MGLVGWRGGRARAPAASDAGRRLGRFGAILAGVDPGLLRKRRDDLPRGLLRHVRSALPAVDGGEGDAEALGELLLGEVQLRADCAKGCGNALCICHVCYICYITNVRAIARQGGELMLSKFDIPWTNRSDILRYRFA